MSRYQMTLIDALPIEGLRTLIRVDFNVPLEDGAVADDSRIRAALPTIEHAIERGARIILCSHLGRPKGQRSDKDSLAPAGERLAELLDRDIPLSDFPVGDAATRLAKDLRDGQIMMLENLRFHPGEEKNDDNFARQLAALAERYVNDAFGAAHRAHASTAGVAAHIRDKAAGFLMAKEIEHLGRLLDAPKKGFVAVLGGAKVSDKIGVIEKLMDKVDTLLIGGAMAYTFLAAQGHAVGESKVEDDQITVARRLLDRAEKRRVELLLPEDHGCAPEFDAKAARTDVAGLDIPAGLMGLDIGKRTARRFAERIANAKTIFWNGPMGVFEFDAFAAGTRTIANAIADSAGYSVVGGGDSVRAVSESGRSADIDHISTGGGASLEFIEGRELPGLTALGIRR